MGTKKIFQASMITAVMIISTTIGEARHDDNAKLQHPASAHDASQGGLLDLSTGSKMAIVGSWLETVTVAGGPTFRSLLTYTDDGAMVGTDQGSVITDPSFPHVFSANHGVWVHQGGRTFSATFLQLISDLNGNLLYLNKVRETVTLSKSRDAYRVVWTAKFTDPAGNPIVSFEGTSEGRRIKAEPLQ